MSIEEKERKNELTVCGCVARGCADANECKKKRRKKKKKITPNGCMQTRMRCVPMPMSAKKREEKKKLTWNGSMQTGMCCVWMVLHVDGVACGWCCVQMVLRVDGLYGDVDGGSCRDGGHG